MSTAWGLFTRSARRAVSIVLYAVVFALAIAVSLVIHIDTAPGRRLVARVAGKVVSDAFVGGLRVDRIDLLTPRRLLVSHATLTDRLDNPVLEAQGIDARFVLSDVLRGIFRGKDVRVIVPDVRVDRVTVRLIVDRKQGGFTIETALDMAPSDKPSGGAGKKVFVGLPHVRAASATVTTNMEGFERASADVAALSSAIDVSPSGVAIELRTDQSSVARLLAGDLKGSLNAELSLPGTTHGHFDARIGRGALAAAFEASGSDFDVDLSSGALDPGPMRDLFGSWPLLVPLRANAHVSGPPEGMSVRMDAAFGAGRVSGTGFLTLDPHVVTRFDLRAEAIDLRSFDGDAPETSLDVDANVSIAFADGVIVDAAATVAPTRVSGYPIPAVRLRGRYSHDGISGNATILDAKLATDIDFEAFPDGRIEFATTSADVNLEGLARYGVEATGHATVRSSGVLDHGRLAASVDASLRSLAAGAVRATTTVVHGRVEGWLDEPGDLAVDVVTDGERLEAAGLSLERFHATSKGSLREQTASFGGSSHNGTTLDAGARLSLGNGLGLRDIRLKTQHGDSTAEIAAELVSLDSRGLLVGGLSIHGGGGTVSGTLDTRSERKSLDLTAKHFDVAKMLAAFDVSPRGIGGRFDVHGHVEEVRGERSGQVIVVIHEGAVPSLEGITTDFTAAFDHSAVAVEGEAALTGVAQAKFDATGSLRGSLFGMKAPKDVVGRAALEVTDLDLGHASDRFFETAGMRLGGHAHALVRLAIAEPRATPEVSYEFNTRSMTISKNGAPREASEIRVDVDSVGDLFRTGGSVLALNVVDAQGPWIAASVDHYLGAEALTRAAESDRARAILDAPLRARITAYPRPLKMFDYAGVPAIDGSVSAVIGVTGSARRPEIDASGTLTVSDSTPKGSEENRLDVELRYSARTEHYTLQARTAAERDHIELRSAGRFGWLEHGLGRNWSARGEAVVTRFGLSRVGQLIDVPVEGNMSGRCSFDTEPGNVDLNGEVAIDRLAVDRHEIGSGTGRMSIADGRAEATLEIAEAQSKIKFEGDTSVIWSPAGPKLDPRRGGAVRLFARDFELSSVQPFVRDVATRVSGKLNGRAELNWGRADSSKHRQTKLRADVALTGGTFNLAAGGGLIQDVDIEALADGDAPLRVDFSAAARSRKPNVSGTASLHLDGPHLSRVDADIGLDGFPLMISGVLMGRATTRPGNPLEISLVGQENRQTLDIAIPAIKIDLPKKSDKNLIALESDQRIEIADAPVEPEEEQPPIKQPSNTTVKVHLGNQVHVARGQLDVPFGGDLRVSPDGRLTGTVEFRQGGVVPALGQIFKIRQGVVHFKDQEINEGSLTLQAWARLSDGTLVDLDISGTVGEPVVGFRSDPPRSKDEIVALLLGIQPDKPNKTALPNESAELGRTAVALAMNRLLEGSAFSSLQFGAGETSEGDSVSTVSMRVSSDVWLEGRAVRGSVTSVNQDERVSGVVDWRFAPSWSLRSQLGGISGVEIRWSHRYR